MKYGFKKKSRRVMVVVLGIITLLVVGTLIFVNTPQFGGKAEGERKARILSSPNYREGSFKNHQETPQITSERGYAGAMYDFLFGKKPKLTPEHMLPTTKTDLLSLDRKEDVFVWFGHSSYFMQVDGKRILVDPVFSDAGSPVPFFNRSFKGTNIYGAADMPEIDYLFISHDHWDHLDYPSMKALRQRTGKVICGLGVGAHLERWKFLPYQIVEMDWNESVQLAENFQVHCLPARHFSGRGFSPNQTLWASFLIQTPSTKIYLGGDSGYGEHYKTIQELFGRVDLAIMENGQYDQDWRYIHAMPEEVVQAAQDLQAGRLITVHNSRFALAKHKWDDPLVRVAKAADDAGVELFTPIIGEKLKYKENVVTTRRWWEESK